MKNPMDGFEFSDEEYLNFVLGLFLKAEELASPIQFARWMIDYMGDVDLLEDILSEERFALVEEQMEFMWAPDYILTIEEEMQVAFFGEVVAE